MRDKIIKCNTKETYTQRNKCREREPHKQWPMAQIRLEYEDPETGCAQCHCLQI